MCKSFYAGSEHLQPTNNGACLWMSVAGILLSVLCGLVVQQTQNVTPHDLSLADVSRSTTPTRTFNPNCYYIRCALLPFQYVLSLNSYCKSSVLLDKLRVGEQPNVDHGSAEDLEPRSNLRARQSGRDERSFAGIVHVSLYRVNIAENIISFDIIRRLGKLVAGLQICGICV